MVSSAVNAVAVVLLLQSTCWIGVLALHDITVEGGERRSGGEVNWDYSDGPRGPAHWHELKCDWAVCKTGKQQSPIQVERKDQVSKPSLGPLKYEYRPGGIPATIVNEGHAVVVEFPTDRSYGYISIDYWPYQLRQFHYHMPSEHRFVTPDSSNRSYALEIHQVYKADCPPFFGGSLAVVSFLFDEGAESPFLAQFCDKLPSYQTQHVKKSIGNITLMDMWKSYGHYIGSLTTPPCTEQVTWTINWDVYTASKRQLDLLRAALPHSNNRPTFSSTGRGFGVWPEP
ncbi:hypothetical protein M758_3G219900 [Ceratodon purpureus]|nr:hypothetical protein M758_3G219900 [Ceratodon purpureus]